MTKVKDLSKKSEKDLLKIIQNAKAKLRDLRFKASGSGLRDSKEIRELKKEVARAFTFLKQKTAK